MSHQLAINTQGIIYQNAIWLPSRNGHDVIEWKEEDPSTLDKAKKIFEEKLKQGWQAFIKGVKDWEEIKEFDPKIDKILLLPSSKPLAGGG